MAPQEMPGFVRVVHDWSGEERWNAFRCRVGRFGARSRVPPGLYALGTPGEDSPAVLTASYRLTFDLLRRGLAGVSCWVIVVDTRGLDVASAAAGGRFGTDEVVTAVLASRLERVVRHRRIVLPGLAAAAVDAPAVLARTGFESLSGPLGLKGLAAFLEGRPGAEARPAFTAADALALLPAELGRSLRFYPAFAFAAILFAGLGPGGVSLGAALGGSWPLLVLGLAAVLAGSGIAPVVYTALRFVPLWIAGEAAGLGAVAALLLAARFSAGMDGFLQAACWVFFPAASAAMAARFRTSMPAAAPVPAAARQKTAPAVIALAAIAAAAVAVALVLSKLGQLRGAG